jgi:hypothetical protein
MEDIFVPLGMFAMVAFVVYVKYESARRRHQQAMEFHARILDRMGSAREFGEFLGTEAGYRFLDAMSSEGQLAQLRILRFIQLGIVLIGLGAGLLVTNLFLPQEGYVIGGIIVAALGAGSLLSAAVSYRLLPRLGLAGRKESIPGDQRSA